MNTYIGQALPPGWNVSRSFCASRREPACDVADAQRTRLPSMQATTCTSSTTPLGCGRNQSGKRRHFVCGGGNCLNWLATRVTVPAGRRGEMLDKLPEQGKPQWKTWLPPVRHARLLPVLEVHPGGTSWRYLRDRVESRWQVGISGLLSEGHRPGQETRKSPPPLPRPSLRRRSRRFWRLCARSTFHHGV